MNDFLTEAVQKAVAKEALKEIDIKALASEVAKQYQALVLKSCKVSAKSVTPMFTESDLDSFYDGFSEEFSFYELGRKTGKDASKKIDHKVFLELLMGETK